MGYVFRADDARLYDEWFQSEQGRIAWEIEKELFRRLWKPPFPQEVLEVGSGTGHFLEWVFQEGHHAAGLEPSPSMRELARSRLPACIAVDQGRAEDLPFEDNAFDTVALIHTLEFVDNPVETLREAFRVARRHVLLGTINRYSIVSLQRRVEELWKTTFLSHAHFFSVFELERLVHEVLAGSVPLRWKTSITLPMKALKYLQFLERSRFFTWHPFGHFIAMCIDLCYPLQTVQNPLFCNVSSPVGHASLYGSGLRSAHKRSSPGHPLAVRKEIDSTMEGYLKSKVFFEGNP